MIPPPMRVGSGDTAQKKAGFGALGMRQTRREEKQPVRQYGAMPDF